MNKILLLTSLLINTSWCLAANCDVKPGISAGVRVMEFVSGNVTHSKMSLKESSIEALTEELSNLQDMGVCEEKVLAKTCLLKTEKHLQQELVVLYREQDRWVGWAKQEKRSAEEYLKKLKQLGFCS